MKRKIIYITPGCFDKGGISRYSRYQIQALRRIYGDNKLYVMSLMGPESDSFEEAFEVDYSGKSNSRWEQIKLALHFIKVCLSERPKIIHSAHVNLSGLTHFISKIIGAQSLLNVYGLEVWSGLSRDAFWGLKNTNFIISDCHNTKNYLVSHHIRKEEDIDVIWDCIDLEKFKTQSEYAINLVAKKYNLPPYASKKTIMTLGRLSRSAIHKGYHRLLEAFAAMSDPDALLVICGKGDMSGELKRLAVDKGISSAVIFTGMIHEEDMAALYSYPDVFSLISEVGKGMGEGIPLTPLEAMACGTPIVVGHQDGSKEAIFDHPSNGYAVDPHNINSHVEAYRVLLNDPIEQSTKSASALQIAQTHFSYDIFVTKHKSFFITRNLI